MIKVCYNTGFINLISFVLSILIVMFASFGINKVKNYNYKENPSNEVAIQEIEVDTKEIKNTIVTETKDENIEINSKEFDWYIEIPKIKLYAPIEEGTEDEILDRSVGHFENTSRRNGNCGLAAHNRGYRVNYFANVKQLEKGDVIYYFVDEKKYEYKVEDIAIIYETDWSYLEETKDNKITLITCVENRGEYRLCVQGVLVNE